MILDQKYNNSFLSNFKNDPPLIVSKDTSLFEILMIFQDKGQSVALISDENKKKIEQNKGEEVFYSVKTIKYIYNITKCNFYNLNF